MGVPNTTTPAKYIRFIYNRLILENSLVRAAAVDALAKIAIRCPHLRPDVMMLLQFEQNDNDDEVRDRILLYSSVLENKDKEKAGPGLQALVSSDLPFSIDALYEQLLDHNNSPNRDVLFDVSTLPSDAAYKSSIKAASTATQQSGKKSKLTNNDVIPAQGQKPPPSGSAATEVVAAVTQAKIIAPDVLGPLHHSSKPKALTENEAEYMVQVIKHMFKDHIVLEFVVTNTDQKVILEQVEMQLTGVEPSFLEVGLTKIPKLEFGMGEESAYVVLEKVAGGDVGAITITLGANLKFEIKEDADDVAYEDEYPVENVVFVIGDYCQPRRLAPGQWKSVWEQHGAQSEATQKLVLSYRSVEQAVEGIIQNMNMEVCDKTGKVEPGARAHTMQLSGTFVGGHTVLAKAVAGMDPNHGCVAKITCRSGGAGVSEVVARAMM